jgi:hypothetical protein
MGLDLINVYEILNIKGWAMLTKPYCIAREVQATCAHHIIIETKFIIQKNYSKNV